ncbi:MAG: hypothetical protein HOK99_04120, partial [Betaproteobacteria bacterium]|nr:hypothetical protein [Betaproteobacteria bacterium]
VIVCTRRSCFPSILLGLAPDRYKSSAYRTQLIHKPRTVLHKLCAPSQSLLKLPFMTVPQVWVIRFCKHALITPAT